MSKKDYTIMWLGNYQLRTAIHRSGYPRVICVCGAPTQVWGCDLVKTRRGYLMAHVDLRICFKCETVRFNPKFGISALKG